MSEFVRPKLVIKCDDSVSDKIRSTYLVNPYLGAIRGPVSARFATHYVSAEIVALQGSGYRVMNRTHVAGLPGHASGVVTESLEYAVENIVSYYESVCVNYLDAWKDIQDKEADEKTPATIKFTIRPKDVLESIEGLNKEVVNAGIDSGVFPVAEIAINRNRGRGICIAKMEGVPGYRSDSADAALDWVTAQYKQMAENHYNSLKAQQSESFERWMIIAPSASGKLGDAILDGLTTQGAWDWAPTSPVSRSPNKVVSFTKEKETGGVIVLVHYNGKSEYLTFYGEDRYECAVSWFVNTYLHR